jgi:SAM-dependent methyltransferase
MEAQSFSVKRAQVEFHNFASLGQPERAFERYMRENTGRGAMMRRHLAFAGKLAPFLEIGANAGHSSYMLVNEFGAGGFALDISADALRYGIALQERCGFPRAPVRVAGDAVNLPFRDGCLAFVMAFQTLSQFMDLESVFGEVKRVLAPGGVFLFAEEPLKRLLSLRLYRCPYYENMKPWERKLYDWGLLGYLVRDVIGAYQEESFGIRQNHSMYIQDWHRLVEAHFAAREYEILVPERGWAERAVKQAAVRMDPYRSVWRAARLLGGTLAAFCRKAGQLFDLPQTPFEALLRCPDCHGELGREAADTLVCRACPYQAANEGGVYNLLRSWERAELYPGDRDDTIDFSLPGHERHLVEGWHAVEGDFGNKYRWIGASATARLTPVRPGPQRLRVRGHAPEPAFNQKRPVKISVRANDLNIGHWTLERSGLFVLEADLPDAPAYTIRISVSPTWHAVGDARTLSVTFSGMRLVAR